MEKMMHSRTGLGVDDDTLNLMVVLHWRGERHSSRMSCEVRTHGWSPLRDALAQLGTVLRKTIMDTSSSPIWRKLMLSSSAGPCAFCGL